MSFFPGKWLLEEFCVGHADANNTGCTVVLSKNPVGSVAGVHVGGGAPGGRETDVLASGNLVGRANAILLTGGSAYGLAAAEGVVQYLAERSSGYPTEFGMVPIVSSSVLYDLGVTTELNPPSILPYFPNSSLGYQACLYSGQSPAEGNVGVGAGATVGKILGMNFAMKTGVGICSDKFTSVNSTIYTISVVVVSNALGDIVACKDILAGAYNRQTNKFLNTTSLIIGEPVVKEKKPKTGNTTILVIATDFPLDNVAANKAALTCQDALAVAISPVHTMFDGDTIYVTSSQDACEVEPFSLTQFMVMANQVAIRAIERSATEAAPLPPYPSYGSIYCDCCHYPRCIYQ